MNIQKMIMAALIVPIFFLTGCASIVGQSSFPVMLNSNPAGANLVVRDENGTDVFSGQTPATVSLTAGESYFHAKVYDLTFSKPGFADQHAELRADIDGWYFANIILPGNLIWLLVVDPLTGKMWKLPLHRTVDLQQKLSLNNGKRTMQIASLDQVPQEMRKNLIKLN